MATHIALLRGINLGGRNKVAMAELRELVSGLGHTGVSTYIQSGNVLFTAGPAVADTGNADSEGSAAGAEGSAAGAQGARSTDAIAAEMTAAIAAKLGVNSQVIVLTRDELHEIIAAGPYPDEPNHKCVHAVVFAGPADQELLDRVAAALAKSAELGSADKARVIGRALYLHTPNGFGRSKLGELLSRPAPKGGANGTARNWATMLKLKELSG